MRLEFAKQILEKKKNYKKSNFKKIRPAGAELSHADEQ
jgi:hypothetical protein